MIKVPKDFNKSEGYYFGMIKNSLYVDTNVGGEKSLKKNNFFLEMVTGQEQKRKIASLLSSTQLN